MKKLAFIVLLAVSVFAHAQVTVGSKKFTESYVLGEVAKRTLIDAGIKAEHKQGMGATAIVWAALKGGSVQAYPEYTGTISEEILKQPGLSGDAMQAELNKLGIGMTGELGFNDGYAIVMKKERAEKLGIKTLSDLKNHPELVAGPTHEFLVRKDGWVPLMAKYGVKLTNVKGIEHSIGYTALNSGQIDLKDCYSTDAEIQKYGLTVLDDDQNFFPQYHAVFLYRLDTPAPAVEALKKLAGTIDATLMIKMNTAAGESKNYEKAASIYFETKGKKASVVDDSLAPKEVGWIGRHLFLVGVSLLFAVIIGIPLGVVASRPGPLSSAILGVTGVLQTVPSLALLALLVPIPFLGISIWTAILALFLYSLLPIVRNTATGIQNIAPSLRESAVALGLEPRARLLKIELPLAARTILAGIKTSAIINVGTATIAALIGAGGLGEPIISGLSNNDNNAVLQGAIPAAVLAILVQVLFDVVDRVVIPKGLRV